MKLFSLSNWLGNKLVWQASTGKPVFLFFLFFILVPIKAQENLVPNGSFEEYYSCPTGNDLNDGQLEKCKYWWKPTLGTSDYFNACQSSIVGVPTNFWGYQEAYEGSGYIGLVPISWLKSSGYITGYEYVQTKLFSKLEKCKWYTISIHLCLSDFTAVCHGNIGALLTRDTMFNTNLNEKLIVPQETYINFGSDFMCDSVNWVELNYEFVANGGEQFLTLGLFDTIPVSQYKFIQPFLANPNNYGAYYYIDGVSIKESTNGKINYCDLEIPNAITPNDDDINDFIDFENSLQVCEKISIVNRWGNLVFTANSQNTIWYPKEESDGVYFYIAYLKKQYNEKTKTGFIQLMR